MQPLRQEDQEVEPKGPDLSHPLAVEGSYLNEMNVESQWRLHQKSSDVVDVEHDSVEVSSEVVEVGSQGAGVSPLERKPRGSVIEESPVAPPLLEVESAHVDPTDQKKVRDDIKKAEEEKKNKRKRKSPAKKTSPNVKKAKLTPKVGTKRSLEKDFERVSGVPRSPKVVASPKAKRMAGKISDSDRVQAQETRRVKAKDAMDELVASSIDDLQLPDSSFDKMYLDLKIDSFIIVISFSKFCFRMVGQHFF